MQIDQLSRLRELLLWFGFLFLGLAGGTVIIALPREWAIFCAAVGIIFVIIWAGPPGWVFYCAMVGGAAIGGTLIFLRVSPPVTPPHGAERESSTPTGVYSIPTAIKTPPTSSWREETTPFEHKNLEVTPSPLPTPQSYQAVSIRSPTSGTVECEVSMSKVDDTGQPLLLDNLRDIVHQDTTSARPACKLTILSLEAEDKATPSCREGWAEVATLKYEMSDIRTYRIFPQYPVSPDPQCDTREEPIDKRAALIAAVLKFRRALVNERSVLVNGESQ